MANIFPLLDLPLEVRDSIYQNVLIGASPSEEPESPSADALPVETVEAITDLYRALSINQQNRAEAMHTAMHVLPTTLLTLSNYAVRRLTELPDDLVGQLVCHLHITYIVVPDYTDVPAKISRPQRHTLATACPKLKHLKISFLCDPNNECEDPPRYWNQCHWFHQRALPATYTGLSWVKQVTCPDLADARGLQSVKTSTHNICEYCRDEKQAVAPSEKFEKEMYDRMAAN